MATEPHDEPELADVDDADAVAREHGRFMLMRQIGEGDKAMLEPLPGKIDTDGNAVFLHFGEETYVMKRSELVKRIADDLAPRAANVPARQPDDG